MRLKSLLAPPMKDSVTTKAENNVLLQTDFPELELHASGKVRDVYRVDNEHLLIIATDRISAFDYVLASGIPDKGKVLTQISVFWFGRTAHIVDNHLLSVNTAAFPGEARGQAAFAGRSM